MNDAILRFRKGIPVFETAMQALLNAEEFLLGVAKPPPDIGVYALYYENDLKYIGEAKGKNGLYDRLINKHISGDDRHTLHKVFLSSFPNKDERKAFIKTHISAKWVALSCPATVSAVERLLIWSLQPEWNEK